MSSPPPVIRYVPRLQTLAFLYVCGVHPRVPDSVPDDCVPRREFTCITKFIRGVIQRRRNAAKALEVANLQVHSQVLLAYDLKLHDYLHGAHVIDSQGGHHILGQNTAIPPMPPGTTVVSWVRYDKETRSYGHTGETLMDKSAELAEWAHNRHEYQRAGGEAVVELAKKGKFY